MKSRWRFLLLIFGTKDSVIISSCRCDPAENLGDWGYRNRDVEILYRARTLINALPIIQGFYYLKIYSVQWRQ